MTEQNNFHMTPSDFRAQGHLLIDWIADYQEQIESYPVMSQVQPGEIRQGLPTLPPQQGEPFSDMLKDVENIIMPGITHWQSPNFYAYFPANTSGPAILGELLSAGLGVQGMIWMTSPACTELETHVMDWLVDMMGLPQVFKSTNSGGGVIQDTASNAALTALLAGRERATNFASNEEGVVAGKLVVYTSSHAHSSLEKAVKVVGIGRKNLRSIPVDEDFAMLPDALAEQIRLDKAAGLIPCFVCATVGTTSSNAMDPLRPIGEICQKEGIWLHVDAAMSGTAALCPEFRYLFDGLELADSYCFNPHKWMFTNFDCSAFFVADRTALLKTLSILPEYLRNEATESGAVFDYRDWHVQLGRRFRALKLWFVIRHYGVEGLQYHVREHVRLTKLFVQWVEDSAEFELSAPAPLNLVCFHHIAGDALNESLVDTLNKSGKLYLTHTKLKGRYTLRLAIGQTNTQMRHVQTAWQLIQATARELQLS